MRVRDGKSASRREANAEIAEHLAGQVDTAEIRLTEFDAATFDNTDEWNEWMDVSLSAPFLSVARII